MTEMQNKPYPKSTLPCNAGVSGAEKLKTYDASIVSHRSSGGPAGLSQPRPSCLSVTAHPGAFLFSLVP